MMKSKYKIGQVVTFNNVSGFYFLEELVTIGTVRIIHKSTFRGVRYEIDGSNLLVEEGNIIGLLNE